MKPTKVLKKAKSYLVQEFDVHLEFIISMFCWLLFFLSFSFFFFGLLRGASDRAAICP